MGKYRVIKQIILLGPPCSLMGGRPRGGAVHALLMIQEPSRMIGKQQEPNRIILKPFLPLSFTQTHMYSGESRNRLGICMSLSVPRMEERRESGNRHGISCSSQCPISAVSEYKVMEQIR